MPETLHAKHCKAFSRAPLRESFFYGMIFVDSYTLFGVD